MLYQNLSTAFPHLNFKLMNAREADEKTLKDFPLVIFGASTWDDGLNPDTKVFFEKIKDADLSKNKFALFGLGDSQFLVFCAAQPIIAEQLKKQGANLHSPVFTFNNYQTGYDLIKFFDWAKSFVTSGKTFNT